MDNYYENSQGAMRRESDRQIRVHAHQSLQDQIDQLKRRIDELEAASVRAEQEDA